jgi:hypothetical protein
MVLELGELPLNSLNKLICKNVIPTFMYQY